MSQRRFILVLGVVLASAYLLSLAVISRIEKTPLNFDHWDSADLISAIERYDFTGVWFDRAVKSHGALSRFRTANGTAHLQFRCDTFDVTSFSFANITFEPSNAFWLNILLTDGYSTFSANKFLMRVKVPASKKGQTHYGVHFRSAAGFKSLNSTAGLNLTLDLGLDRVQKTHLLEDLDINIGLLSDEPEAEMDVSLRLKYNNYYNTQGVFRFLSFGFLLGLFETALLLYMMAQLDRRDNLSKEQSVIFWTSLGMFDCLFCFIYITNSAENMQNLSYFFVNAMLNFVNFGLVILRILHRIGKVQLGEILASSVA